MAAIDTTIKFKNILPIGGKVLTIYRGVVSFLVLYINNSNQLCLSRLSNMMTVLFTVKVASFFASSLTSENFALAEDERGYIHVVLPYTTSVRLLLKDGKDSGKLDDDNDTAIVKLSNDGEIISFELATSLQNYNLVNIKGLTWMFSNMNDSIQIRNLTIGGMISYIFSSGGISVISVYYFNNKVYITGMANGKITYHDTSIILPPCAYLLILDVSASSDIHGGSNGTVFVEENKCKITIPDRRWSIFDYFYATNGDPASKGKIVFFSSFRLTPNNYFIAGYTNIQTIDVYQKGNLLKTFNLTGSNVLILCKITLPSMKVTLIHHPFNFNLGQKIFLNLKRGLLLLSGRANDPELIGAILGKVTSHINKYNFMITFDNKLKALNSTFFGSGRLDYQVVRANCTCSDCPGDGYARYNPNRIMRMFPPGATDTANMGRTPPCSGSKKGIIFSGTTCDNSTNNGFVTTGGCVFTSYGGNFHCLPSPVYANTDTSPGDLYNTKYKGYSSLPVSTTLEMVDAQNGPSYSNENIVIDESTGDVYATADMTENLVVNDQVTTPLYSNYDTGYLVSFS